MAKIKEWYVVVEWDDWNGSSILRASDFAPDVEGYLKQFMQELEQEANELEV